MCRFNLTALPAARDTDYREADEEEGRRRQAGLQRWTPRFPPVVIVKLTSSRELFN
jgi:hypothetical protein